MKEMVIRVPLRDDCDSKQKVFNYIIDVIELSGDRFLSIESVEIDGEKIFGVNNPNGFKKGYFKC